MHSEASTIVGSYRIQQKTWQTKDKLERYSEQGHSKNGVNPGLKHQLKTDRLGVSVWPYASAMLDESSQVKSGISAVRRKNKHIPGWPKTVHGFLAITFSILGTNFHTVWHIIQYTIGNLQLEDIQLAHITRFVYLHYLVVLITTLFMFTNSLISNSQPITSVR